MPKLDAISSMTVEQLKLQLRDRGMPVSGRKSILQQRLRAVATDLVVDNNGNDTSALASPTEVTDQTLTNHRRAIALVPNDISITTQDEADHYGRIYKNILSPLIKTIEAEFEPGLANRQATLALVKRGIAEEKSRLEKYTKPLLNAVDRIKSALEIFRKLEEKRQQQEQKRLKQLVKNDIDARLEELLSRGEFEEAQRLVEESRNVSEVTKAITPKPKVKVEGMRSREYLTFSVIDVDKVKREYLTPDLSKIRRLVNDKREAAEEIVGGIKVEIKTVDY